MIRHIHLLLVLAVLLASGCSSKSTSTGTPPSTPVRPPAIPMVSARDCPPGIITTMASSGRGDHSSVDLVLNLLDGIAAGPKGDIHIADTKGNRIRKIDEAGVITTVAGTGHSGFSGDGGPAAKAELDNPTDVAVAPDGSLYIADHDNWRVRKVGPAGIITTVAGGGKDRDFTDGIRATKAHLRYVSAIAVGPDGSLYVGGNHRIRKVDQRRIITTIAGDGGYGEEEGSRTDGARALKVSLRSVNGLAIGPDGSLYFAISDDHQVCKIDPKGIIHTIAGNGVGRRPARASVSWLHVAHFSGDGGPATEASLACPHDVALGPNGSIYIADSENERVRKVSPKRIITTVAGAGRKASDGDGVPATTVSLGYFHHIAVAPNGILYIVTENRIRKVCPTR